MVTICDYIEFQKADTKTIHCGTVQKIERHKDRVKITLDSGEVMLDGDKLINHIPKRFKSGIYW